MTTKRNPKVEDYKNLDFFYKLIVEAGSHNVEPSANKKCLNQEKIEDFN